MGELDLDADLPAGADVAPGYMPGFTTKHLEEAKELNDQASAAFAEGTEARATANKYVRDTVLPASVLFCVAIAQRFKIRGVRMGAKPSRSRC